MSVMLCLVLVEVQLYSVGRLVVKCSSVDKLWCATVHVSTLMS